MTAAVLLPFRGGDPGRERVRDAILARWARIGVPVFSAPGPTDGPFNKSAALNACARLAAKHERLWGPAIVADADVLMAPSEIARAIALAAETKGAVRPFSMFHRVDEAGTTAAIAGRSIRSKHITSSRMAPPGGILVVPRDLWEAVGGMDERFLGWGGEDNVLLHSLRVMGGPIPAVRGAAWHLWHPRPKTFHEHTKANRALLYQYYAAKTPAALRKVIASRTPGASVLAGRHPGETATIVGKGVSLLTLTAAHFPPGPVITLNSALLNVRRLGLPNPIYTLQKDMAVVEPREPETLVLSWAQSVDAFPAYPRRVVVNVEAEFDLRWGAMSAPVAVELARVMGCSRVVMLAHDGYTVRNADKVEDDRVVHVRPGGYYAAGVHADRVAKAAGLAIEWVRP